MLLNLEITRIGCKKFEDYQNHIGCHISFKFNYFQIRQGWGHYPLMRLSSVLLSFGPENSISMTKVYIGLSLSAGNCFELKVASHPKCDHFGGKNILR